MKDQSSDLFAAFMPAAAAAADGRDAVITARAPPTHTSGIDGPGQLASSADPHEVADSIAASAALLARLDHAAGLVETSRDHRACLSAGPAARQIRQLLASADDANAR